MRRETTVVTSLIILGSFGLTLAALSLRQFSQASSASSAPAVVPLRELPALLPGQARVRLLDPQGQPVSDCMANLWQPLGAGRMAMNAQSQASCHAGVLLYTDLAPASYRLQVAAPGWQLFDKRLLMEDGQSVDFGDIVLGPGALLTGELLIDGEPAPGARVRFDDDYFDNTSDRDGRFRMRGAPLGLHSLRGVAAPALAGDASIEITAQGPNHVVIELEPLPARGTLGLQLEPTEQGQRVSAIHPLGPAAGKLSVGEVLLSADGASLRGMEIGEVRAVLAGDPSSVVHFTTDRQELDLARIPRSALE